VIHRAHSVRRLLAATVAGGLLVGAAAGCTSEPDRPSLRSAGAADLRTGATATSTAVSITPVTPDGLLAGPGVTDGAISLGVLADPARDRGFTDGVRLWQRSVNTTGGLCGRTIELRANGADGIPDDPAAAYGAVGTSVLGLLTPPFGTAAATASTGSTVASGVGAPTDTSTVASSAGAPTGSPTVSTSGSDISTSGSADGSSAGAPSGSPAVSTDLGPNGAGAANDGDAILAASITADQIPAVTPTGTSAQLGPTRPIVAGATADILAINGLQYLLRTGTLHTGDVVSVLSDGSATAQNALRGARWWAQDSGLDLDLRDPGSDPRSYPSAGVVLAPVGSAAVSTLITRDPGISVLTLADGFDPGSWPADAVTAAAGRLYVATPAPAYGSDYPAAVAVSSMAAAGGSTDPGVRTLDGYATGTTWGRLIRQACADRSLTRAGVWTAAGTVGPAPATSLFGASDPGLVVQSALPATRVSSVSVADAAAPAGLRSLIALESAPGIGDYRP
jgi:hypothetical protein